MAMADEEEGEEVGLPTSRGGDATATGDDSNDSNNDNINNDDSNNCNNKKKRRTALVVALVVALAVGLIAGLSAGLSGGNSSGGGGGNSNAVEEEHSSGAGGEGDDDAPGPGGGGDGSDGSSDSSSGYNDDNDNDNNNAADDIVDDISPPTPRPTSGATSAATPPSGVVSTPQVYYQQSYFPTLFRGGGAVGVDTSGGLGTAPPTPTVVVAPPRVAAAGEGGRCDFRFDGGVAVDAPSYDSLLARLEEESQQSEESQFAAVANTDNRETVNVTSIRQGGGVFKQLSGGASAFDGKHAVVVSYNSDGTAGAVWAITVGGDTRANDGGGKWKVTGTFQNVDSDQLGWDVAVGNNRIVLGAPGAVGGKWIGLVEGWMWAGRGRAYVMSLLEAGGGEEDEEEGTGGGTKMRWVEEAVLEPSVADDHSDFGTSVDIAECGCLIAVGAWHDRDSRGSVYVYSKSDGDDNNNGGWTEVQKLAPEDSRRSQSDFFHGNFGYTVAITDEYLAVKAPYDSYTGSYEWKDENRGVVHVYRRVDSGGGGGATSGPQFAPFDRLYAPEGAQVTTHLADLLFLDEFLLVGAPGRNRVYVFERARDGGGTGDVVGFRRSAVLTPSDSVGPDSYFGVSLDGSGRSVLVGSKGNQTSYLFAYEESDDGPAWVEKAKFDGFNTAFSGELIIEHTPKSFEETEDEYGGEVSFYDLECEE